MNRQRLILALLLVILAIAVVTSIVRFPRQKSVDSLTFTRKSPPAATKSDAPGKDDTRLRLDLLQKNQVAFSGFKRNIFAPIFRDMSKLPAVKPVIPAPPPPPPPPVAPPVVNPVERDLAQFTFLGFLDKDRKKIIFLSKGKEIFLVKKGERIAGKYEAVAITDEALTIRSVGETGNEIIIPLIENQALKTAAQRPVRLPAQSGAEDGTGSAPAENPPVRVPPAQQQGVSIPTQGPPGVKLPPGLQQQGRTSRGNPSSVSGVPAGSGSTPVTTHREND